MKGYVETHTVGWLKRIHVEAENSFDIEKKSEVVCQVLAGIPLSMIIVEEVENRLFRAITEDSVVKTLNEFMAEKFKLADNWVLKEFLPAEFKNKSFSDLTNEKKDTLLTDQQVAVFIVREYTPQEKEFILNPIPSSVRLTTNKPSQEPTENRHVMSVKNPIDALLEEYLLHPFFSKVNIANVTTEIIIQLLMVSATGVDRELSSKNVLDFKNHLPDEKAKELREMPMIFDFLNRAFPIEKNQNLKKAHLPMIFLCAKESLAVSVKPERFSQILDQFFSEENHEYKLAGQSGTSGKGNVNTRIRIMLDYFHKHI